MKLLENKVKGLLEVKRITGGPRALRGKKSLARGIIGCNVFVVDESLLPEN